MARWFRRKAYGYGWTPASWEGWVVAAAYTAGVIAVAHTHTFGLPGTLVLIAALTAALFAIILATSGKDSDA